MSRLIVMKDINWVRSSFLVPQDKTYDLTYASDRFKSSSRFKFYDTSPGGWRAINPPPQATGASDIILDTRETKTKNRSNMNARAEGLGRWWAESIDDPAQIVTFRFGVPRFTSLTTFFTGFYNYGAGQLARTGRGTGVAYFIGKAAGFITPLFVPLLLALQLGGQIVRFLADKPASRFYSLKPNMPAYWNAVNTIVNHIAVNSGIIPRASLNVFTLFESQDQDGVGEVNKELHRLMPDIFREKGGIDVYALSTRYMRRARKDEKMKDDLLGGDNWGDKNFDEILESFTSNYVDESNQPNVPFEEYLSSWLNTGQGMTNSQALQNSAEATGAKTDPADPTAVDNTATVNSVTESITQTFDKDSEKSTIPDEGSIFSRLAEHGGAELDDGASFVSFRVDHTGSINDSFTSSLRDNDMQGRINSVSNSARNMKFELSGGNINETMTAALGHVTNIVRDVVGGYIDGIGIAGLATLQGAGLVDIPQHWDSSSVNIGKSNYSFTLMPMYNTPISRLLHQVVPLAMILAGVLPLSTGKQSYTSPFICEYYDKGRCQDRLAMITDVSISRGAANTPYNLHGDCLGIDVTFSVTGMSRMMHMPLVSSFSLNPFEGTFDEETIFTDYMAVLSGLGMTEQVYRFRRLALNITQKKAAWDSYWSAARFGTFIANVPPVRLLDVFYDGRR